MKRSCALALSSAALFLAFVAPSSAQSFKSGQQCTPAVAQPAMFHNCRLRLVQGQEVCRCTVRPQALRRMERQNSWDQNSSVTRSIATRPAAGSGFVLHESGTLGTGNGGTIGGGTAGTIGGAGPIRGGVVADSGNSGGNTSGTGSAGNSGGAGSNAGSGSGNAAGHGNNGHGNDPDGNDSSNPGGSNNGDGTDADGPAGNGGNAGGRGGDTGGQGNGGGRDGGGGHGNSGGNGNGGNGGGRR